ncbi:acetyl-CoA acetyltransferase, cytosolic [Cylas formicarius]|uniref:acetyl-CoA acetyltransferase, cytosolic n=1 Tax=Cylas formicarius TaxID=197179 RepID=UPI00295899D1|nr:acetyl-CoA acetyltransferase, cytosolic [Cylas formicarius]
MNKVFIVSGCRTAIGNFQGQFDKFTASELGTIVISEAISRANLTPNDIEQVIIGQVLTAGQGQNPARQAAVKAQIPYDSPAYTINMLCGSGLKSVALAFQAIKNEDCAIVVAGGQESMTKAEHTTYLRGNKLGNLNLNDTLLVDGLTDHFNKVHMGNTAEHLAKVYNITREEQDTFSVNSQYKAEQAIKAGYFEKEIVSVPDKRTKKAIDRDEFPKFNSTLASLAKLKPCFETNGTVTAANASGINDGAAALVLVNEQQVKAKNLCPLAEILAFAEVGVDPMCMGIGPITAVQKVLQKVGWSKEDVDLYELNEAFAVQSIVVIRELGVDESKVNITGGAVALGHPIGASGARILVTLVHNLIRQGKTKGVASLCIGGGMGIAMAVKIC